MAYDEFLEERIDRILRAKGVFFESKKMMGGLCYLVDGKMCIGIVKDHLMARIGPVSYEAALVKPGCKPMDFTGKPMKGYVFVSEEGIDLDSSLEDWIDLSLAFNPLAKSSKGKG